MLSLDLAGDDVGIVFHLGDGLEHLDHGLANRHQFGSGLGIRQPQHASIEIDKVPLQLLDFAEAAAGQEKQVDAVHSFPFRIGFAQHFAQAGKFIRGEIPFSLHLLVTLHLPAGVYAIGSHTPGVGDGEHDGKDAEGAVGLIGRSLHRLM